ncbi:MAG: extracellular solute-binding protein [Anaerolineae bacterium]|nr:extracellular solute-binding protein [Anaerolineae bacterium]
MHRRLPALVGIGLIAALMGPGWLAVPTAAQGNITVTYWETFGDQDGGVNDLVIETFKEAHPNVTVERVFVPFGDMSIKLRTALASGQGPDLIYADQQPAFLGSYVKAGQILPLDRAFVEYGWDQRVFGWAQKRVTYFDRIYGVGHEVEDLMLMYNGRIFDELGLEVPTTLEELETVMQTIKDNSSYTPMMLATGGGGPWNGIHMINAIAYATMDVSKVLETTPQGTGSYTDPDWLNVLKIYEKWAKAGYFYEDANAVDWEGHWALLCAGQAAMLAQGTWLFKPISECEAENPELFEFKVAPFPSAAGRPYQAYVGIGSAWYLSAEVAKDPELHAAALDLLDALISPEAAIHWVQDAQLFPAVPFDQSQVTLTEQQKVALEVIELVGSEGGGPVPICFNNSAEELDIWQSVVQGLFAGRMTPEVAIEQLEVALVASQQEWQSE